MTGWTAGPLAVLALALVVNLFVRGDGTFVVGLAYALVLYELALFGLLGAVTRLAPSMDTTRRRR